MYTNASIEYWRFFPQAHCTVVLEDEILKSILPYQLGHFDHIIVFLMKCEAKGTSRSWYRNLRCWNVVKSLGGNFFYHAHGREQCTPHHCGTDVPILRLQRVAPLNMRKAFCNLEIWKWWSDGHTLRKFNSSPLQSYRNPIGKDRLPTTIFQGLCWTCGVYII